MRNRPTERGILYRGSGPEHQSSERLPANRNHFPSIMQRPGMPTEPCCPACGATKDLWEANRGQGWTHHGKSYCCKPCAEGKDCVCFALEKYKGQELGGLHHGTLRSFNWLQKHGHGHKRRAI